MVVTELYHSPALSGPQLEDFRRLNEELKLRCSEEDLEGMAKNAEGVTAAYQRVSEFPDTSLPVVRYPRTPGYRPGPDDNPYNACGAAEGKLSGRTVGIKDNTAVAGVPMRNGSKILENYVPEFDATVVTRILDAGGRIIGKTSVEDMCSSGSSITNSDGPVRNPRDESRIAGGSSSGSGALVAAGLVDMAIGGDQGGSIRIPASFTGIVGLKPTYGLVPYTGASTLDPSIDHLGPMARTVSDCALLLEVIAGYDDGRDPRQFPGMTVPQYSKLIEASVSGKRDLPPAVKFHALYSEYMTQLYGRANKFYAKANNLKMELTRQYDAALQKFDVLVMPTMPFVAPKIPPAGISYLGMMIVGKKFDDVTVLQMARAVETIAPKDKKLSEVMGELTANFQRVSEIPDPSIPRVRYPRTPGHRPTPEENPYNAWAWRCDIRGAAEGKLSGRTVGIKDNIAVAGVPMRNGSKLLENYVPEFDATVVTKILDAGKCWAARV
nr:hypothetical protein BaRGS_029109 [Batillaria attramentaria]